MASRVEWCKCGKGNHRRVKPWKARVKIDWLEYFLGYYTTKEEAELREREFKNATI